MGPRPSSLSVLVLHNCDYRKLDPDSPHYASLADVEQAAQGIAGALAERGHRPEIAEVDTDCVAELLLRLDDSGQRSASSNRPDLVFNLCESLGGDSRHEVVVPSLLDLAGIPYTGSNAFALGLALRKDRAKEILRARGVSTPESACVESEADLAGLSLPFPLIVKPAREDASVGIDMSSVVRDRASLERAVLRVLRELAQPALVERFIEGRELYVSLIGNAPPRALPFHEIDFSGLPAGLPHIVSYAGKWDTGSPECEGTRPVRCLLDEDTRARCEHAARAAFDALGLADYARVDLRLAADGTPYVIDVNPNCDLSDGAGFSRAAGYGGLDYPSLVERVCQVALERCAREHGIIEDEGVVPLAPGQISFASLRARGSQRQRRFAQPAGIAGVDPMARVDRRRAR